MEAGQGPDRKRGAAVPRPRLTGALDRTSARVRMLIGPAGYGKTTLAREWASGSPLRFAWYTARNASSDVAYLCVGLGEVAAEIVPGCDRRVRERLMATPDPVAEADVLAEMLAEQLHAWPEDAWLVVDDYDLLAPAAEAEAFVHTLVTQSPLRLLVVGRVRPAWVSSRSILYGEVFELGQSALALSREEAGKVLSGWKDDVAAGLIALADGWPAVIGLAGLVPDPAALEGDIPDTLQAFLAEEIFQALDPDVREALTLLALLPTVDRELATELLGGELAKRTAETGSKLGVLDAAGGRIELHPLVRVVLEAESTGLGEEKIRRWLNAVLIRRDWDGAFDLISRHGLRTEFEHLLATALDELLVAARLVTLERWTEYATNNQISTHFVDIARVEVAFRHGKHLLAQTLAEAAARGFDDDEPLRFRALMLAAQAANVGSREDQALGLFRNAELVAPSDEAAREARWGQVMCLAELESSDAQVVLDSLATGVTRDNPREMVREAGRRLGLELRSGRLRSLPRVREVNQLLPHISDAIVRASFRSVLSTALALSADYRTALLVAEALTRDAEEHRLDFVLPYGRCAQAVAKAGLHEYASAQTLLDLASADAVRIENLHAELYAFAIRQRVLVQEGRCDVACSYPLPDGDAPVRGLRGELAASRALALACAGRLEEARRVLDEVRTVSRAIEPVVLIAGAEAVLALRGGEPRGRTKVEELVELAFTSGGIDLLVTCYRGSPEILSVLLGSPPLRERAWQVIARVGDHSMAGALGQPVPETVSPINRLTPREREIHALLSQGLTNQQIAEAMFISVATVKVHAHRIYEKLGVPSRTALVINALRKNGRSGDV